MLDDGLGREWRGAVLVAAGIEPATVRSKPTGLAPSPPRMRHTGTDPDQNRVNIGYFSPVFLVSAPTKPSPAINSPLGSGSSQLFLETLGSPSLLPG